MLVDVYCSCYRDLLSDNSKVLVLFYEFAARPCERFF